MKKYLFAILALILVFENNEVQSQSPGIAWQGSYWPAVDLCPIPPVTQGRTTSGEDWFYGQCKVSNGSSETGIFAVGYVTLDYVPTNNGCVSCSSFYSLNAPSYGDFESTTFETRKGCAWLAQAVKTDLNGKEIWQKTIGDYFSEFLNVIQGSDGYFYAIGRSGDWGADIVYNKGPNQQVLTNSNFNPSDPRRSIRRHFWIVKLDADGNIIWQNIYGDYDGDPETAYLLSGYGSDIVESSPGNFVAVGYSAKTINNITENYPFAIEVNAQGTLLWKRIYTENIGEFKSVAKLERQVGSVISREYSSAGNTYPSPSNKQLTDGLILKIGQGVNHDPENVTIIPHISPATRTIAYDLEYRTNNELLVALVKDCDDCNGGSGQGEGVILRYNTNISGTLPYQSLGTPISIGTIKANDLKVGVCNTVDGGFAVVSTKQNVVIPNNTPPFCPQCTADPVGLYDKQYWNTDAYIAKFNAAVTPTFDWSKQFDNTTAAASSYPGDVKRAECVYDILELNNGELVICGNGSSNFDDGYLVKLYNDCNIKQEYTVSEIDNVIEINGNTTWSSSTKVKGLVVVKASNTLTISGNNTIIEFADTKRIGIQTGILVEPGATLLIENNAVLTALQDCPESMWDGIIVMGKANMVQSIQNQGRIKMRSGAVIEHARAAVQMGTLPQEMYGFSNSAGGIIDANNAIFRDNQYGVVFNAYYNANSPLYYSPISACQFLNSGILRDPELKDAAGRRFGIRSFIKASSVKLLNLENNWFEGAISLPVDLRGIAIDVFNSHLILQYNQFSNLSYGVYNSAVLSVTGRTRVLNNSFVNVRKGIFSVAMAYEEIKGNTFSIPGYSYNIFFPTNPTSTNETWGVKFENAQGFLSTENSYTPFDELDINSAWGTIVSNSAGSGGLVKGEVYTNIAFGTQAEEYNPFLQISCNTYQNHFNAWSINPQSATGNLADQGQGVQSNQKQAGNLFDNLCSIPFQEINSNLPFTYFSSIDANVECQTINVKVEQSQNIRETSCESGFFSCNDYTEACMSTWLQAINEESDTAKKNLMMQEYIRVRLNNNDQEIAINYLWNNKARFVDSTTVMRQAILTRYSANQIGLANTLLQSYPLLTSIDQNFIDLMDILINADSATVAPFYFNTTEIADIENIAFLNTEVGFIAKAIIRNLNGTKIDDMPELWNFEPAGSSMLLEEELQAEQGMALNTDIEKNIDFKAYPNPSNNFIEVESESGQIKIYSNLGVLVKSIIKDAGITTISLTGLAPGLYTLQFSAQKQERIIKLVIY